MSTREREVESYLVRRLGEMGLDCVKFNPDLRNGMPDRLVLLPEREVLWVETKKPDGGRVAELQKYQHSKLRKAGHEVVVVWTKEQADELCGELSRRYSI